MKIVENASKLYKAWTVILPTIGTVASVSIAVVQSVTELNVLSVSQLAIANAVLYALTGISRFIQQKSISG